MEALKKYAREKVGGGGNKTKKTPTAVQSKYYTFTANIKQEWEK